MSASTSQQATQSQNTQYSVEGGSGSGSVTATAGGGLSYNDPTLQLETVQALANVVQAALQGAGTVTATAQQQNAAQSTSDAQILSDALAAQQNLSSYQGTNGGLQQSQTSQYVIWGAIGVAALAVVGFIVWALKK